VHVQLGQNTGPAAEETRQVAGRAGAGQLTSHRIHTRDMLFGFIPVPDSSEKSVRAVTHKPTALRIRPGRQRSFFALARSCKVSTNPGIARWPPAPASSTWAGAPAGASAAALSVVTWPWLGYPGALSSTPACYREFETATHAMLSSVQNEGPHSGAECRSRPYSATVDGRPGSCLEPTCGHRLLATR